MFLLILTNFFCLFRFNSCYKGTGRVGLAGDEKNQMTCLALFGLQVCLFYFLYVLLIFSVLFRFYLHFKMTGRVGLGGDEKNGPKGMYFFFIRIFSYFN